jgi:molybdopterin-guanine dinucleotide biosynthesis protein B
LKVLAFVGWSGSGKTTLLTAVLPLLVRSGLRVSTIKHAHHGFDLDQPGKDSWRHREAGAREVLIASARRWALLHEASEAEGARDAPDLAALLPRLAPVDLVLAEGFKSAACAKLEVHRPALGKPPLWSDWRDILAVASDAPLPGCDRAVLPLNSPAVVAEWVIAFTAGERAA